MSALIDRAMDAVRNLPDEEQEAIAAIILDEIEDDIQWEASFARSPGTLATLAARAVEQVRAGECRIAGFDEL